MDKSDTLCREIAEALDVTPAELKAIQAVKERAGKLRDAIELLEAFQELRDEEARRRCISYVKSEAQQARAALYQTRHRTPFGQH